MLAIGARFDDRITGRLNAFSPGSTKIHVDIDPSSHNKPVHCYIAIVGDAARVLEQMIAAWKEGGYKPNRKALDKWWAQIDQWRARDCLKFKQDDKIIKPQYAIQRLYELTRDRETFITTEVGQHQMWAAQFYKFNQPNRSEEHTSELQSLMRISYAVFCLKKKTQKQGQIALIHKRTLVIHQ